MLTQKMNHDSFTSWSKPGIRAQLLNAKTLELEQDFIVQQNTTSIHILNKDLFILNKNKI